MVDRSISELREFLTCRKPVPWLRRLRQRCRRQHMMVLPDMERPVLGREGWQTTWGWQRLRGKPQPDAIRTVAAVMWVSPYLGAPLSRVFPDCARQLQGWRRVPRGKSQAPVPYVVAAGAAKLMAEHDLVEAFMVLLMFEGYLVVFPNVARLPLWLDTCRPHS